jgi:hypothetical protein
MASCKEVTFDDDEMSEVSEISAAVNDEDPGGFLSRLGRTATELISKQYFRTAVNVPHKTLEDFGRIEPELRRLVVIGCTGAGKSTLLNKVCGYRCAPDDDEQFAWDRPPLFASSDSVESVTKCTSWAKGEWFGDEAKPFVVVDTPGHDDPEAAEVDRDEARALLSAHATDLHEKLKAMGHAHLILVLHSDPYANRLNPATFTILRMVDEKFKASETRVWRNVVFAYTRCDEEARGWKTNMEPWGGRSAGRRGKRAEMQKQIRDRFKFAAADPDVPVLCLSGVETGASTSPDFLKLWDLLARARPLDTSAIRPFEHVADKIRKIVGERNAAVLLVEAHRAKFTVLLAFAALAAVLAWRALLPRFLSRLLLNYPGPEDEIVLFTCLFQFLGPQRVASTARILWDDHGRAKYAALKRAVAKACPMLFTDHTKKAQ